MLVNQLIADGAVFEGATGEAKRGRKPTFLYMESRQRCVVAVDIRPTRTFVMVTDLLGRQLASVTSYPTERDPKRFVTGLAKRINAILAGHDDLGRCEGVGVVVPGMVDAETGRVLLGAESGLARSLVERCDRRRGLSLPVEIENSGKACALAQLWSTRDAGASGNFVYLNVSDGLGVGVVRGRPARAGPAQHRR